MFNIETLSFDRSFYSADNEQEMQELIDQLCLSKKSIAAFAEQQKNESVTFHNSRKRHPGVESAIGALQFGNGSEHSRDRTEAGFRRSIALGILGRNLHAIGKLILQSEARQSVAAFTRCKQAA